MPYKIVKRNAIRWREGFPTRPTCMEIVIQFYLVLSATYNCRFVVEVIEITLLTISTSIMVSIIGL